ncbi:MAG TPA: GDP-mannose 4,6-dehydratase [Ramlibacter sp.]|jgi:GDP-4-dehydro-6-deoxy-D-mannose reductase
MVILVTGARGFVGQSIVGEDIIPFEGDIRDATKVRAVIENLRPKAIIHLAAIASPREAAKDAAAAWNVNVIGTFNLAQAVLDIVPHARFIFAGSSEVYGESFADAMGAPVSERVACKPLSRYGATKAAAEIMLLQMAQEGLQVTCFRPFNHTGPRQAEAYVIPAFARQIARIEKGLQEPVIRTGNIDLVRDFVDVEDIVRAYTMVARSRVPLGVGQSINLASGSPATLRWMLDYMLARSSVRIRQELDSQLSRANEIKTIAGAIDKAQDLLEWRPLIRLEDTLDRVLAHWRSFIFK